MMLKINRIALLFCIVSLSSQSNYAAAPAPQDGGKAEKGDQEDIVRKIEQVLMANLRRSGHSNPAIVHAPNGNSWIATDPRSFSDPNAPWLVPPPAHLLSAANSHASQHSGAQASSSRTLGSQAHRTFAQSGNTRAGFRNLAGKSRLVPLVNAKPAATPCAAQGSGAQAASGKIPQQQNSSDTK